MAKQSKPKPGQFGKPPRPGFAPKGGPGQGAQGKPTRVPVKK
jgi:hypothetical protein